MGFGFFEHVYPEDLIKCRFPGVKDASDIAAAKTKLASSVPMMRQDSNTSARSSNTDGTSRTLRPTTYAQDPLPESEAPLDIQAPTSLLNELIQDGVVKYAKNQDAVLTVTTEMRLRSKDNEYRWHLVQGSYIDSVNFGAGDAQWIIACADISDQKDNEAKLQLANKALEMEMSRKMEYLSSMSHEIRTPLNGIIGNLQFLNNSGLDEHQQEWSFGVEQAANGMQTLINDILDVSKAEAKMLKLSLDWFSPRANIEQVLENLISRASEKHLELCYEIADAVPWRVKGDGGRIRQILLNLVGNAIKFTKYGEILVKCDFAPEDVDRTDLPELEGNEILLRWQIIDTGTGFSDEDAKLLFKPYSQIDNSDTRHIGGTGLGLILCRTMVELHGGKIYATSAPGEGSTFTFYARFLVKEAGDSAFGSLSSVAASVKSAWSITTVPSRSSSSNQVPIFQTTVTESPMSAPSRLSRDDQDSPALLSDGSSTRSLGSLSSVQFQRSLRSSTSTVDSVAANLTLPSDDGATGSSIDGNDSTPMLQPRTFTKSSAPDAKSSPITPEIPTLDSAASSITAGSNTSAKTSPISTAPDLKIRDSTPSAIFEALAETCVPMAKAPNGLTSPSIASSSTQHFPPPNTSIEISTKPKTTKPGKKIKSHPKMLSILVVCPMPSTRRTTTEHIKKVLPTSVPAQITSEEDSDIAL
jgi:signal transduction histidine kinase